MVDEKPPANGRPWMDLYSREYFSNVREMKRPNNTTYGATARLLACEKYRVITGVAEQHFNA